MPSWHVGKYTFPTRDPRELAQMIIRKEHPQEAPSCIYAMLVLADSIDENSCLIEHVLTEIGYGSILKYKPTYYDMFSLCWWTQMYKIKPCHSDEIIEQLYQLSAQELGTMLPDNFITKVSADRISLFFILCTGQIINASPNILRYHYEDVNCRTQRSLINKTLIVELTHMYGWQYPPHYGMLIDNNIFIIDFITQFLQYEPNTYALTNLNSLIGCVGIYVPPNITFKEIYVRSQFAMYQDVILRRMKIPMINYNRSETIPPVVPKLSEEMISDWIIKMNLYKWSDEELRNAYELRKYPMANNRNEMLTKIVKSLQTPRWSFRITGSVNSNQCNVLTGEPRNYKDVKDPVIGYGLQTNQKCMHISELLFSVLSTDLKAMPDPNGGPDFTNVEIRELNAYLESDFYFPRKYRAMTENLISVIYQHQYNMNMSDQQLQNFIQEYREKSDLERREIQIWFGQMFLVGMKMSGWADGQPFPMNKYIPNIDEISINRYLISLKESPVFERIRNLKTVIRTYKRYDVFTNSFNDILTGTINGNNCIRIMVNIYVPTAYTYLNMLEPDIRLDQILVETGLISNFIPFKWEDWVYRY